MALTGTQKAYRYALSNVARSGATRSGYVSAFVYVSIGGSEQRSNIALGSLTITDSLDEVPNTCRFRVIDTVPAIGQLVIITLGSANGPRLFAGHILTVQEVLGGKPSQVRADVSCVDFTWWLGFQKVTKRYANWSVYVIVQDLIQTYASVNGFTAIHVDQNLPGIDEITFTNEDLPEALTRLARRIGAYWYVDYYKDVHLFFTETRQAPTPLTPTHPTLAIDDFSWVTDRTQTLTRVYVEGRGSRILADVAPGESLIPLETADMFAVSSDVFVKAAFQGSEGGAQHLNFSGVVAGGLGALVGPGIGPSAPVSLAVQAGAGVESGTHGYAVTFVTAGGESLASPTASITPGPIANPTIAITNLRTSPTYSSQGESGWMTFGDQCKFAYAYRTAAGETLLSAETALITVISNQDPFNPSKSAAIRMVVPYSSDPRVTYIKIYIWATSQPSWKWSRSEPNVTTGGVVDLAVTIYGADPHPGANTTGQNQIVVSAIPIGAATVTARKLYRTAASLAQLKLLTTIADNTATTYTDSTPDASLGANIPISDTSGLLQPAGQIPAGATTIPVAGTVAFQASGGWAVIGNGEQVIRYTGLGAGSLTGIPASGIGAVTAAISYNSTITAAAMLTGIPASGARAIQYGLTAGGELYLVVQVDDTARQTALAASIGGGPGVREEWIQDRRLSITEARARGQATLAWRPLDHVTLAYRCRDVLTAAGQTVTATFPAPINISATLKVQTVTIDNFRPYPNQPPTYHVQASTSRFSFEDWLRTLRTDH